MPARKRPVAAIVLIAMIPQLTACTSWRVQPVSPAQALSDTRPRDVRLRLRHDSSTVVIPKARFVGDSIVGYREPATFHFTPRRVSVPLADVQEVAVSRVDAGLTVVAVFAAFVAVSIVARALESLPGLGGGFLHL
ncbi:MAG: hypothetical protein ABSG61_07670 [Gemmatimonadales bacterium]|jgi:hypothetical protein